VTRVADGRVDTSGERGYGGARGDTGEREPVEGQVKLLVRRKRPGGASGQVVEPLACHGRYWEEDGEAEEKIAAIHGK